MSKPVASVFQASDRFLERFFKGFPDAHNLAYRAHLRPQLVFYAFKLLKRPACKFNYDIIPVRHIAVERPVLAARNLRKRQPGCEHRRYERNRKSGRLGRERRRARRPWINLNNDIPVGLWIMRPLYVRAADHLDRFYDFIRLFLQALLHLLRDRQHRRGAERVPGVHAKRVDIFNKAYRNHMIISIPHNFQLQFFPS